MKVCAVCVGQQFKIEDHLVEVPNPVEPSPAGTAGGTTNGTNKSGSQTNGSNGPGRSTSQNQSSATVSASLAGSSAGNTFTTTTVTPMFNSVGILKSELNSGINLGPVTANGSGANGNASSQVMASNNHGSSIPITTNSISITNTNGSFSPLVKGGDDLAQVVSQVAEQVIIDTTHTYSLPDPNLVKKEPRSPIRTDKIAVSIHQMPATA